MKIENPALAAIVSEQMKQVRRGTFPFTGSLYRGFYQNYYSRGDIVLDAVTYGKGDWNRSIRYLELAAAADPSNMKVRDALGTVRDLSALAKP